MAWCRQTASHYLSQCWPRFLLLCDVTWSHTCRVLKAVVSLGNGVTHIASRKFFHYADVIMSAMASQITGLTIVYSIFIQAQIKENIKAPRHWPFVWGIHRRPVNSPHKRPVTRKMLPFDDVIMSKFFVSLRQLLENVNHFIFDYFIFYISYVLIAWSHQLPRHNETIYWPTLSITLITG